MNRITKTEESPQKPIWESLLERASNKKQELQKLIEEKKQKEDQLDPECTFKPSLIAIPNSTQNQLPFFERQKQWVDYKTQKINQKRDGEKNKSLEKCSFQPELGPQPNINDVDIKNTKGIDTFIQRQEKARKLKEQKQILLNNPYSHLSSEKKALQISTADGNTSTNHPISKEYESIKKAERIEFSRVLDNEQEQSQCQQQKMQLGEAMKILHNQLYNIKFKSEF